MSIKETLKTLLDLRVYGEWMDHAWEGQKAIGQKSLGWKLSDTTYQDCSQIGW